MGLTSHRISSSRTTFYSVFDKLLLVSLVLEWGGVVLLTKHRRHQPSSR